MADKNRLSRRQGVLYTLPSQYASRGENVRKVRLLCRLWANFWLLTRMFSRLLSLMLEALKNGYIAALCRNNSPLQGRTPSQCTTYSVGTVAGIWDLN